MAVSTELAQQNTDLKALQQVSFETTNVANPTTLQEYINIAKMLSASGFWPDAKSAQQAVALMLLGRHFGLSPIQSLTAIHVVKGKPMLHYSAILAKVREHPHYEYEIVEDSAKRAAIQFYYKGKPCGLMEFTPEKAKLRQTQNMDKMPDVMLLARATGDGVRRYCPDVLNGMTIYAQGEIVEDDNSYSDAGMSNRDKLKAELQARIAEEDPAKAQALITEGRDVPGGDEPYVPEGQEAYTGPTVREDGQEAV